jgi:hypothetical protein
MTVPFHRRSQRILLQVVVLIRARTAEGSAAQAQGFTQCVSAHGGLLDVPFRMLPGQHLTLINPLTKQEASGRVVRVGASRDGYFATSFEFYGYTPQFWPVSVAPSDWSLGPEFVGERR